MNAAVYIRWSTEDQGSGTTLDVQRDACLRCAADKGWTVAPEHIFIDDGVSGAKESRPALNRLNSSVQQGAVAAVIVYKLDRLARSPYLAYRLVEKDWHKKASLVSVTEAHIDTTTTTGQLGFGIAAIFAAHERNTIRDRTLSGKRRRAEEGRNPGLRPPYGYAVVDRRFVALEVEAVVVCRIYADFLAGQTEAQIRSVLNHSGIRTRAGGRWHASSLQRILTNPAYCGRLVYRDITTCDAFPALVDRKEWEQVQALRRQRGALHPRRTNGESPYILSGRLWCGHCGRPMNGRVCRNGDYENRYYACTGYIQYRDCACRMIGQQVVEAAVVGLLLPLLDADELNRRLVLGAGSAIELLTQEASALAARLADLDHELGRVRQDYRKTKIDADTFTALQAEIETEQAALCESLSGKRAELGQARLDSEAQRRIDPRSAWDLLNHAQRKQVIRLLTERIEWDCESRRLTVRTVI